MRKLNLEKTKIDIKKRHIFMSWFFLFFFLLPLTFAFTVWFAYLPPQEFPVQKFQVKKNESVNQIAERLKEEGFINSNLLFKFFAFQNKDLAKRIQVGIYEFNEKDNVYIIFKKLVNGDGDISKKQIELTIKPGEANYILAKRFAKKMPNIEEDDFTAWARKYEGQLATDSLSFDFDADAKTVVDRFHKLFWKKIKKANIKINKSEENKIFKIASLVESEAGIATYQIRRHVAGVIYNRLRKKMPLQIDATFYYLKKTMPWEKRVIYKSDFKIDSKYNTYKYSNLPPTPISNPSIWSIKASLNPLKTKDLFYITGKDGNFYFTHSGKIHNQNVQKYLRNWVPQDSKTTTKNN